MRAVASAVPPGAVGTRILTGLLGQGACACAADAMASRIAAAARLARSMDVLPVLVASAQSVGRIAFYSAWMLAVRAMFDHFSRSALMRAVKSADGPPTGSAPSWAS